MTDVTRNVRRVLKDPFRANQDLTDRERQVASLAAQGYTGQEIGSMLNLSTATIAIDMRLALAKLGLKDKRDLTKLLLDGVRDALTEA